MRLTAPHVEAGSLKFSWRMNHAPLCHLDWISRSFAPAPRPAARELGAFLDSPWASLYDVTTSEACSRE